MSETKRIVLIANIQILGTLSQHLSQRGYEILRELPMITTTAINDIILLKPDSIVISEGCQYDDGYTLLETIHTMKSIHKTKARIIVHTQTRKVGDSLLSDLIALNVYDFIPLSAFDLSEIIMLLENPREFTDVSDYYNYAKESTTSDLPLDMPITTPIEIIPTPVITKVEKERVGTVVISVANLQHGSGATHNALTIANFLSEKRLKVAVVELKKINDYGLIYLPRKESYNQYSFKYRTFDVYANDGESTSDDLLIAVMSKNYNYIVLDIGLLFDYNFEQAQLDKPSTQIKKYNKGNFYNDFMKADIKIVNSFASIQFADSIEYFMNYLHVWDIRDINILFSFTSKEIVKNYKKYLDSKMYLTPINPDNESLTEEQTIFYNKLLERILPIDQTSKKSILISKPIKKIISFVVNRIATGARKVPIMLGGKNK